MEGMRPGHVVSGEACAEPHCFVATFFRGQSYQAYTTRRAVVIVKQFGTAEQLIPFPEAWEVRSLQWNRITGALTIAFAECVYQYLPAVTQEESRVSHSWKLAFKLPFVGGDVRQIDWLARQGQLLVAGRELSLWQFPYFLLSGEGLSQIDPYSEPSVDLVPCVWRMTPSSPAYHCSASPDGRYFVTAGQYDRLPKLWYRYYEEIVPDPPIMTEERAQESEQYEMVFRFSYLPHPRAVTSMQWRPGRRAIAEMQNLLLTNCYDGITRCWMEDQPFAFSTCAVIPGGEGNVFSWMQYHPFVHELATSDGAVDTEEELRQVLQRKPDHLSRALEQNEKLTSLHREQSERFASSRLLASEMDTDWIVQVEREHLISFWQLSQINPSLGKNGDPSRSMPVLSLWLKTKVSRTQSFPSPLALISLCQEVADKREPSRVVFYMLNQMGQMCQWDTLISENAEYRSSTARLCSQTQGHHSSITGLIRHSTGSLVSSLALEEREAIVWKSSDSTLMETGTLLHSHAHLTHLDGLLWLTEDTILTYTTQGSCEVFRLMAARKGLLKPHSLLKFQCKADNRGVSLEQLFLLPSRKETEESQNRHFDMLSLSDQGCTLRFWSLELAPSSEMMPSKSAHQQMKCLQTFSLSSAEAVTCVSAHPVLSNTLYTIPSESEHAFAFVTGGVDGLVRLWRYDTSTDTWNDQHQISAHCGPIVQVECIHSFQLITLGSRTELNEQSAPDMVAPYDIRIWERYSDFPNFTMKQVLNLSTKEKPKSVKNKALAAVSMTRRSKRMAQEQSKDTTEDQGKSTEMQVRFSYQRLCNGHGIMAVCVDEMVHVYLERLPEEVSAMELQWTRSSAHYELLAPVGAMLWDLYGNLLVTAESQITVFSPWVEVAPQMTKEEKIGHSQQQANVLSLNEPPFHPKVLLQYLLAGKFDKVDKILRDLSRCLGGWVEKNTNATRVSAHQLVQPALSELLEKRDYEAATSAFHASSSTSSYSNGGGSSASALFGGGQDTAANLFAPKPAVSEASALFAPPTSSLGEAASLFAPARSFIYAAEEPEEETKEEQGEETETVEGEKEQETVEEEKLTMEEAEELGEILSRIQVVGMTRSDQMYLIAVIGTFMQIESLKSGLDECGLRFLLSVKLTEILRKSNRGATLVSRDFVWALHCEAPDALLQQCIPAESTWQHAQSLGIGYWLTNIPALRECIKRIAQVEFSLKKSAEDCAIFYIALGQKSALMALFKAVGNKKVAEFLEKDFTDQRWKSAASKNAYALLGRQQYRYAAAFFLLAGSLKSAIGLCVKHLKDFNLPLVFCRLLEGDGSNATNYRSLLTDHILPQAEDSEDIWTQSMVHWLLKDYTQSMKCLIPPSQTEPEEEAEPEPMAQGGSFNPWAPGGFSAMPSSSTSSLSNSLRNSSDSVRSTRSADSQASMISSKEFVPFDPSVIHLFRELQKKPFIPSQPSLQSQLVLLRRCVQRYLVVGCPVLALEELLFLQHLEEKRKEEEKQKKKEEADDGGGYGGYGGYGGFGGFGGMMIISEPEPEEENAEGAEDDQDYSSAEEKYLYPLYAHQAHMAHLTRVCSPQWLHETVDYSESLGLTVHREQLYQDLYQFCKHQHLYVKLLEMIKSAPKECASLLHLVAKRLHALISLYSQLASKTLIVPSMQVLNCYRQARELYRGLVMIQESDHPLSDWDRTYVLSGVFVGFFFTAWCDLDYDLLQTLCGMTEMTYPFPAELLEQLETCAEHLLLHEHEVDARNRLMVELGEQEKAKAGDGQRFLDILLHSLLARALLAVRDSGGLHDHADELKNLIKFLNGRMQATPFLQVNVDSDAPHSMFASSQNMKESFNALVKVSSYRESATKLFSFLFRQLGTEQLQDKFKSYRRQLAEVPKDNQFIKWSDTDQESCLYRESDLIQSFCLNPLDPSHLVLATTKEMREIETASNKTQLVKQKSILRSVEVLKQYKKSGEETSAGVLSQSLNSVMTPRSNSQTSLRREAKPISSPRSTRTARHHKNASELPEHHSIAPACLVSHPSEPYYLSGTNSGEVHLWIFHHNEAVLQYKTASSIRVTAIHWNGAGTKFGFSDVEGKLSLFRFNPTAVASFSHTYWSYKVHSKRCSDFVFLNSGSWIATCGQSKNRRNVCIYDVLLPPARARVAAFVCHDEAGAQSITYSRTHRLVISGGKAGDLCVFNLSKMEKVRELADAHEGNIQAIQLVLNDQFLITGSTDGHLKAWSMPDLELLHTWTDAHEQHRFIRPDLLNPGSAVFTKGVMKVLPHQQKLYSCGADGRIVERNLGH